jgi:drug/metabolite transporter (DMT)-like permease
MPPASDAVAIPRDTGDSRSSRRGALLVACAAICWSSGGLIVRLVSTSPWTTSLWRSLFASLCLALVLRIARRRGIVAQWREGGRPVVAVAVCMSLSSTCFILSLSRTSVANTLILMAMGPYVAGLLGFILLGERVARRTWLTMGVALSGAVVMVSSSYHRGALVGDLLAIVMASSFAVATVLVRRHPEIQMAPAAVLATALTGLIALPLADPLTTAPRDLALLAFFGVGQFAAGFLLFMAGARLIPAAESSLIGMLETVLGPLWVWLVLSEQPAGAALAGGALILAALFGNTLVDVLAARTGSPPRARRTGLP